MNQVVTLTSVEVKKTGTNKRGRWALRLFTAAGGAKYQTFDIDLGEALEANLNTNVELTYEIEDNGNFQNNVIKGWKPFSEPAQVSEPSQPLSVGPSERDQKQRSKEEVRRTEAVKAAATLLVELGRSEESDVEVSLGGLFELADTISGYVETGAA